MYSTDNGPHYNTWPDAGTTPFRSEKNSNWEGAYRVPTSLSWPGKFPAGVTLNGIVSHEDWLPTFAAAAGAPDIKTTSPAESGRPVQAALVVDLGDQQHETDRCLSGRVGLRQSRRCSSSTASSSLRPSIPSGRPRNRLLRY
jgi:arylsulfatase A-like enzyme